MYWIKLIKDIRLWYKFSKIAKENRDYLNKHNLRVDRLGRIYTVINLPEEIQKGNQYMYEAWVLQNLKPFTQVLLEIGIADYAYPEVIKIDEPGTSAYLVIMYPESETISLKKILYNLFLLALILIVIRAGYKLIAENPVVLEHLKKIADFIF